MENVEDMEICATLQIMNTIDELKSVMLDLAKANELLLKVAGIGDPETVAGLLQRISLLERRRNRLVHQDARQALNHPAANSYESAVPFRDQVIRALHLISRPATGRLLTDVTKARWSERIEAAKLSSLRRDEARSWSAGRDINRRTAIRDVYVIPALTYDRFAPVRGVLALSSWELSRRLIAPLSPRVDMLKSTITLAREASLLGAARHGEEMRRLVGRLGASLPGISSFNAPIDEVIAAAEAELSEIEEIDDRERTAAAQRAEGSLGQDAQLFGAPLRVVTGGK